MRDDHLALDIVQDAMLKLSEKYSDRPVDELPLLFQRILQNAIRDFYRRQKLRALWTTPVSALFGDNVVDRSERAPWYSGPTLLEHLESVPVGTDPQTQPLRLPVQYVVRPRTAAHPDYRGYAGRLASGVVRPGDEVVVLPGGNRTTVVGIDRALAHHPTIALAGNAYTGVGISDCIVSGQRAARRVVTAVSAVVHAAPATPPLVPASERV